MEIEKIKGIIEAILFASGRVVTINELVSALEINRDDIITIVENMKQELEEQNRGIEIIKVNDGYGMCTKKEYYEYIYPIFDKRSKPNLSNAALESLAIIAYNPGITRAEIESIRGVNSDATIYKLLEYNLIEDAGKLDAPGRPTTYRTTGNFLKMFGYSNLDELPDLPRYRMDENRQIVIDDLIEENNKKEETSIEQTNIEENQDNNEKNIEAPEPERENEVKNEE
ncbi:MAG: SMC-Scp complex subunit ScpB [Clostridia bacterium]|nr:SMC-Scp complex subunit ScpB [Clostridia bacterium]